MSFRELKMFSEMMKSLGYARLISLDNFRRCNFELVADILYFFCERVEPSSMHLCDDISTKNKRVEFIKHCANILCAKTGIKLKLKHLYKADGYAVQELLKIANFMDEAQHSRDGQAPSMSAPQQSLQKLRQYSHSGSDIVDNGLKLHGLLSQNNNHSHIDENVLLFINELSHSIDDYENGVRKSMEQTLHSLIDAVDEDIHDLHDNKLVEMQQNIQVLHQKVEHKQQELERLQKRLLSLKTMKPAFVEEYEVLEAKNIGVYNLYVEKFKNLSFLQSQLEKYRIIECEKEKKTKQQLKSVQHKLRQQHLQVLSNAHSDDVDDLDEVCDTRQPHTNTNSHSVSQSNSSSPSASNSEEGPSSSNTQSMTHSNPSQSHSRRSLQSRDEVSNDSLSDIVEQDMHF